MIPELQVLVGLGHTRLCYLLAITLIPHGSSVCSLTQWSSGSEAHQNHREVVEAQISAPSPEFPIQGEWGGAQECAFLTSPSGMLMLLTEFFKVLFP